MKLLKVLRGWLECGGCNYRWNTGNPPVTWTCILCGHYNVVSQ